MISVDRRLYIISTMPVGRTHSLISVSIFFCLPSLAFSSLSSNRTAQSIEVSPAAPSHF